MSPHHHPKRAALRENKIRISTYVTLIVSPTHVPKKRVSEIVALQILRPLKCDALLMPQLRESMRGWGGFVMSDDEVLTQIAHRVAAGEGFALIVHTPTPDLPKDHDANLLTHLLYGEATRSGAGLADEMAAIAYTAVNRAKYLQANPKVKLNFFGANDRTLAGVVQTRAQWGSYQSDLWNQVDHASDMTDDEKDFLNTCIRVASGVADGTISDPYAGKGGTYGMRTRNHGSPGSAYVKFSSQIEKARNDFFGLSQ